MNMNLKTQAEHQLVINEQMTVAQTKVLWSESLSQANEALHSEEAVVVQLKKEIFALKEEIESSGEAQVALQDELNEVSNSVSDTDNTIIPIVVSLLLE